ncbi:winged helix-turn-helix domain-containing protein [uncultured Sphingomonas sp.]|uniref:winged helix-turn-helix domain-containing protein n=1 Tax=uncultured Sphingomonas sp. TaxID=158754 RepID=UPI0035CA9CCC
MAGENPAFDPYDAVLADLRAKRNQIDQTIALLTSLRAGGSPGMQAAPAEPAAVNTAGMFLSMSIPDGAKKLLAMRKRTMGNAEIASELKAGGLVLTSAEPANVVGSVLSRRFIQVGDVVKVSRGTWGLKEWYPGRNFKATPKVPTVDASTADTSASEYKLQINDLGGTDVGEDDL